MAEKSAAPALAIRSSVGIELWASSGSKLPYDYKEHLPREETKNSRIILFSPDGRYFAYSNGMEIKILRSIDWAVQCELLRPKVLYLQFSPCGNYLCTWESYTITKEKPSGAPNMFVYEIATGMEVFSIVQKNSNDWEPSWSADESVFAIIAGGEALFYNLEDGVSGFESIAKKFGGSRGGVLKVGPAQKPPLVAFYTPGKKDSPSMCKLYRYPDLAQNQVVACKSFFQADRVDLLWNKRASGLLILASTEVDKSGASYYGNQALHFISSKGDSCSVPLAKEGPLHCVKWSPKATEFVVVYGFMPSKAALYNLKCDIIFDFGTGSRNCAYFNPFGNLLALAGFGNLPGNVEIWDVNLREKITEIKCADTTYFEWSPNGEYFVTATTAPRLRIGNGFKVYHYSGALMHETLWPQGQQLLGVEWQKFPIDAFIEPQITKDKQVGIKSSQPEASKSVYRPPHLRLIDEGKNPDKYIPQSSKSRVVPTGSTAQSNRKDTAGGDPMVRKYNKAKSKKDGSITTRIITKATTLAGTTNINCSSGNTLDDSSMQLTENEKSHMMDNYQGANGKKKLKSRPNNRDVVVQQRQQQQLVFTNKDMLLAADLHINDSDDNNDGDYNKKSSIGLDVMMADMNNVGLGSSNVINKNDEGDGDGDIDDDGDGNGNGNGNGDGDGDVDVVGDAKKSINAMNAEKEKRIRNIARKLADIKKLKLRHNDGLVLELNQINKISMEAKLLKELQLLKISE